MFFGTNPAVVSQFVYQELRDLPPGTVVHEPFAGNFVVSQLAHLVDPEGTCHSTDVSLYSRAIGYALADMPSEIHLKPEYREMFPIFDKELSPLEMGACMIFFSEAGKIIKRQKVAFYRNLLIDMQANAEDYYNGILLKLSNFRDELPANFHFYGFDAVQLKPHMKAGDFVFYDPPVLLGDYEAMFADMERCFTFDQPEYTQMDQDQKVKDLTELHEKGCIVYYRTNEPADYLPDGYREVFRYRYKYDAYYCLYSNRTHSNRTFTGTFKPLKSKAANYPLIFPRHEITADSKVEIIKTTGPIANHYRLLWVKKAEMKDAGIPYLIFIDGKLIGLVQLMSGMTYSHDQAVIISDPAAPSSRYRRLSKLILYLTCTQEMLDTFNSEVMWEHNGFTTRVFTNYKVSMKYRGLFKLAERKDDKDGFYDYCLIYQNRDRILPTFQDGLKAWLKKDARIIQK